MIEIIKEGNKERLDPQYEMKCVHCGCVFKFNHSDIEILNRNFSIGSQHIGTITCPCCGEKILVYPSSRVKD